MAPGSFMATNTSPWGALKGRKGKFVAFGCSHSVGGAGSIADSEFFRQLALVAKCTPRFSGRQVSEGTGRPPGEHWPAALCNRRHSAAKFERLLTVSCGPFAAGFERRLMAVH